MEKLYLLFGKNSTIYMLYRITSNDHATNLPNVVTRRVKFPS